MYLPEHFAEHRLEELARLMHDFPLGIIVAQTASGLDANHIPFELDAKRGACGTLQGHIARANPLWKEVQDGAQVLVIFRASDGYISPSWYPSKHEHHRHVPTWNYEIVHAHGKLRIIDDEKFVRGVVARLTRRHEAAEQRPWKMGDAPVDYLEQMLKMTVGVEVESHAWMENGSLDRTETPVTWKAQSVLCRTAVIRSLRRPWPARWSRAKEQQGRAMYSSTFIFLQAQYDEEFHRLDEEIAEAARTTPGFLGEESWENVGTGLISTVYYWESLEALQGLIQHPRHLEAKSKQENWLAGYQVVISEVLRIYGDSKLNGLLPVSSMS